MTASPSTRRGTMALLAALAGTLTMLPAQGSRANSPHDCLRPEAMEPLETLAASRELDALLPVDWYVDTIRVDVDRITVMLVPDETTRLALQLLPPNDALPARRCGRFFCLDVRPAAPEGSVPSASAADVLHSVGWRIDAAFDDSPWSRCGETETAEPVVENGKYDEPLWWWLLAGVLEALVVVAALARVARSRDCRPPAP